MKFEDDVIVRVINLPSTVRGFTVPSNDGIYNVYLNAKHTYEMQQMAYKHEIAHLHDNDFESGASVALLETKR